MILLEQNMVKDKIRGVKNLIEMIVHHAGQDKLVSIVKLFNGEDLIEEIAYRGKMLECDLGTLNHSIEEILKIAKKEHEKGYEKIREIIEDKEYEHGHYF